MTLWSPLGAHVHVRVVEAQSVSGGGIIIPDTAKKRPLEGVVLSVGPGWRDENGRLHSLGLEVGERVMFGKYAGTELDTDKDLVLHKDHILAVIGTDGESLRAYEDNVILRMAPLPNLSEVIVLKDTKAKHRRAKVLVSGNGYVTKNGALIENTVKAGQRVVVDRDAGQDYAMDINLPRHNKKAEFQELFGLAGDYRIVREEEVLATLEDDGEEEGN